MDMPWGSFNAPLPIAAWELTITRPDFAYELQRLKYT